MKKAFVKETDDERAAFRCPIGRFRPGLIRDAGGASRIKK
jgi:hypothetical protein